MRAAGLATGTAWHGYLAEVRGVGNARGDDIKDEVRSSKSRIRSPRIPPSRWRPRPVKLATALRPHPCHDCGWRGWHVPEPLEDTPGTATNRQTARISQPTPTSISARSTIPNHDPPGRSLLRPTRDCAPPVGAIVVRKPGFLRRRGVPSVGRKEDGSARFLRNTRPFSRL